MGKMPRYPIYVPSKGRWAHPLTARFLLKDETPFYLVVEPQEHAIYAKALPAATLLDLPENDMGLIYSRNWIKDHATQAGYERHWQLDDNIWKLKRRWHMRRIPCRSGLALGIVEDFVDRYENVAVAGLAYEMFLPRAKFPPFYLNCHVYSCTLILNSLPNKWRARYNDDTDYCLQVLADGWCTILINAFLAHKLHTMTMKGGNTDDLYQDDGRLKMARSLERDWPGVVTTRRRFQRPQHVVKDAWRKFDTPLKLKPGIAPVAAGPNEYGMKLKQVAPIKSSTLRKAFSEHKAKDA